jgi:hypothetical protein
MASLKVAYTYPASHTDFHYAFLSDVDLAFFRALHLTFFDFTHTIACITYLTLYV